jgi:fermentation-respiration switch protein FrsA (DUF1100 family)
MPVGPGPFPAVMVCHGFGGSKLGNNRLFVVLAEALTRAGIAVFRIDFRGCGDSEGTSTDITFFGQVEDAAAGMERLTQVERIDKARIGLLGVSLGGAVAVYTAAQIDTLKSLALWSPVSSGKEWEEKWAHITATIGCPETIFYDGEYLSRTFVEQFISIRPDLEMEKLENLPLLHIHGDEDETVAVEHAEVYEKSRKEAKAENAFLRFPNADHVFSDTEDRQQLIQETVEWFSRTLAIPDPVPS